MSAARHYSPVIYRPEERFRAQAFNDFCVFGVAALASLASGAALHYLGWRWLMIVPMPVLVVALIGFVVLQSERRPRAV